MWVGAKETVSKLLLAPTWYHSKRKGVDANISASGGSAAEFCPLVGAKAPTHMFLATA